MHSVDDLDVLCALSVLIHRRTQAEHFRPTRGVRISAGQNRTNGLTSVGENSSDPDKSKPRLSKPLIRKEN